MADRAKNLHHSLAVLSHPLTILVFLLYLANTFLFQRVFPSWWTGKISDFAWLFFFPLVLCLPLSLLLDRVPLARRIQPIYIAVALCGIPFALLKSSVQFLALASDAFRFWSTMSLDVTSDPGDLIALVSLWGAIWFWNTDRPVRPGASKLAYALAISSMFFTLADSPMPDQGIYYLEWKNGYVLACSTYARYQSLDGGMNWNLIDYGAEKCQSTDDSEIIVDPSRKNIQYKYGEVGKIYRSQDAGSTWTVDYNWEPRSDAAAIYVQMKHQINYYVNYPLNAVYEPRSGNVIFAMGSEGVLVRRSSGQYDWRQVGDYQKIVVKPLSIVRELIWGEVYLGFLLACLLVSFLVMGVGPARSARFGALLVYFSFFGWLVIAVLAPPAILFASDYSAIVSVLGLAVLSFACLPLLIGSLVVSARYQIKFLLGILALFGLVILTFPLPYALWALGIHNSYVLAFLVALFMETGITIMFFLKMRRDFPALHSTTPEAQK